MEELKEQIETTLRQLENMIEKEENINKINKQKRRLDTLLEKYLENM